MKVFKLSFWVVIFFVSAITCGLAQDMEFRDDPGEYVPGQVIIGFKPDLSNEKIKVIVQDMGGEIIKKLDNRINVCS
jgi:hypothetical protein